MRVLVTGANGFIGRSVVSALLDRGHAVRAVLRPSSSAARLPWRDRDGLDLFHADLRNHPHLEAAFEGVDVLVHLAAAIIRREEAQFASTVTGTERLLAAMARTSTRRLVLASSFAVYDWSETRGTLDESSPLEGDLYRRDGYAVSKVWQERVTRRLADEHGWALTVLRPGFVWGQGNEWLAGIGLQLGQVMVVVGPRTELPLTHVSNCADCFARVVDDERSVGETYNVVDGYAISSWLYAGLFARGTGIKALRLPVPYRLGMVAARALYGSLAGVSGREPRLPSIVIPCRYEARFKPLRYSNDKLASQLGWHPPHSLDECLALTYHASSGEPVASARMT